jgi:hypothetical protein
LIAGPFSAKKILEVLLAGGLLVLLVLWLAFSPDRPMNYEYPGAQFYAATLLRGGAAFSEISQDAYGFRAMVARGNAYLPLTVALPEIHENWFMPTTHPPTAFLLAGPVAFLSDSTAAAVWAWLSLAAILASLKLNGFHWIETFLYTALSLAWLPTIGSLGQLTPIWLLGLSLAYVFRERNPRLAGVLIGIASLTKYLPALLLIPFLFKRKWSVLVTFILTWVIALAIIYILSPDAIPQYIQANLVASPFMVAQTGGFLLSAYHSYGALGLGLAAGFLLLILHNHWQEFQQSPDISCQTWMIFSYLAVALLPITWRYSYFPLLPGMLLLAKEQRPARIFGICGLIFSSFVPLGGFILYGIGLAWPKSMSKSDLGKRILAFTEHV